MVVPTGTTRTRGENCFPCCTISTDPAGGTGAGLPSDATSEITASFTPAPLDSVILNEISAAFARTHAKPSQPTRMKRDNTPLELVHQRDRDKMVHVTQGA